MENEVKLLKELINIESYLEGENRQIIAYFKEKLKKYECITIKNKNDDRESLIAFINYKKNCKPLLLCGHCDTVVKNNNLPCYESEGLLYGLGSCDMKCFFASILANLEDLENLGVPIVVAITCDEEIKCESVNLVVDYLKNENIFPCLTILGEPTDMTITSYSKGCYEYKVCVKGKACHSSNVKMGINSINICAKLINLIEKLNTEKISLNCGLISGGKQINIVPDYCEFSFDIRTYEKDLLNNALKLINDEIENLLQAYAGCEIMLTNTLSLPCYSKKTELANIVSQKLNVKTSYFNGATEAGFYGEISDEVIIFGAGDVVLAHKQNEYVKIENVLNYYKILKKIIKIAKK